MRLRNVKDASIKIDASNYIIKDYEDYKGNYKSIFNNDNKLCIEIGMGKGDFIIGMARNNPDINFIGIEKYDSVMVRAVEKLDGVDLQNLKLIKMDAEYIENAFDKEIDTIYLNFSDPWPKDRHAKRRLTSPVFLNIYDGIFKDINRIVMKTDNIDLFNYSIDSLTSHGYDIIYKTNNLNCLDGKNIMTEYESKFYNKGIKINKFEGIRK